MTKISQINQNFWFWNRIKFQKVVSHGILMNYGTFRTLSRSETTSRKKSPLINL